MLKLAIIEGVLSRIHPFGPKNYIRFVKQWPPEVEHGIFLAFRQVKIHRSV